LGDCAEVDVNLLYVMPLMICLNANPGWNPTAVTYEDAVMVKPGLSVGGLLPPQGLQGGVRGRQ
jgi:hypothetical protein